MTGLYAVDTYVCNTSCPDIQSLISVFCRSKRPSCTMPLNKCTLFDLTRLSACNNWVISLEKKSNSFLIVIEVILFLSYFTLIV